jgi:hypothetical protein
MVLSDHFERHPQYSTQKQAKAHRALGNRGRRLVNQEVTMQIVHALAVHPSHHLFREDEHLLKELVGFEVLKRPNELFIAHEQIAGILLLVRLAYINEKQRGLGTRALYYSG